RRLCGARARSPHGKAVMLRGLVALVVALTSVSLAPSAFAQNVVATAATLDAVADIAPVARAEQKTAPVSTSAPTSVRRESSWSRSLLIGMQTTTIAAQALDVHSTITATRLGATEANPLMGGLVNNTAAFVAVKGAA